MARLGTHLELLRPLWLAALVAVPLVVYFSRRSLVGLSRSRRAVSLGLRITLVVLLSVALAGPRWRGTSNEPQVVFLLDVSESVRDASEDQDSKFVRPMEFIREAIKQAPGARIELNQARLLRFAGKPGTSMTIQPSEPVSPVARDRSKPVDADATHLAEAITAAELSFVEGRPARIVLLTDGNPTDAATLLPRSRVPIWTVPLASRDDPEVYIDELSAPGEVADGDRFSLDVRIHASRADKGTLRLCTGEHPDEVTLLERAVEVAPGETTVRLELVLSDASWVTLRTRLEGFDDTIAENNTAEVPVFVRARPRVLVVENRPKLAEHLARALAGERIDVEVVAADAFAESDGGLRRYELVVLSNVPSSALPIEKMERLDRYVHQFGGGLVVIGGYQAFSAGGYRDTLLEAMLPVWCVFEERIEQPSLAMVLVLDTSKSMEGEPIKLAREAVRQVVDMLDAEDQLGVVAYASNSWWIAPLRPCDDKEPLLASVETIEAGGATDAFPALDKAFLALDEAFAQRKHIILLSDGISHPGEFDALAEAIAAADITVSTIGLGREVGGSLLADIARTCGGEFHPCDDPTDMPGIFTRETAAANPQGIIERPFFARVSPEPSGSSIEFNIEGAPRLLGYVETQPKPDARVLLASEEGHPLLATWQHGRGTVAAFTSDVESRWAGAWLRWDGFGRFWNRLVRDVRRTDTGEHITLSLERVGEHVVVQLDAVDADDRFINDATAHAQVATTPIELPLIAPGRYATRLDPRRSTSCRVEVRLSQSGMPDRVRRAGLGRAYPEEFRIQPPNETLLATIARESGGTYRPKPSDIFRPSDTPVPRRTPVWPWLLIAAVILLLLDLAIQRTSS